MQHKGIHNTTVLYCIFMCPHVSLFDKNPNKKSINNLDTSNKKETISLKNNNYFGSLYIFLGLIVAEIVFFWGFWVGLAEG